MARNVAAVLRSNFGEENVFLDVDAQAIGSPYPKKLHTALSEAGILLVLIGQNWLAAANPTDHRRRIDEVDDWVRYEIQTALNSGMRVVPILIQDGVMPTSNSLPDSIGALSELEYCELRENFWKIDAEQLVKSLSELMKMPRDEGEIAWPKLPEFRPVPLLYSQLDLIEKELPMWKISRSDILKRVASIVPHSLQP